MLNRIIQQMVATWVTERLLQSPAFHRFAARTHRQVTALKEKGGGALEQAKTSEFVKDKAQRARTFVRVFKETVEKESKNLQK